MNDELAQEEIIAARTFGEAMVRLLIAHEKGQRQRYPEADHVEPAKPVPRLPLELGPKVTQLLLSQREAARNLGICEKTLWSVTAPRGSVPVVRIGRCIRYSPDDLRAWIEEKKKEKKETNGRP